MEDHGYSAAGRPLDLDEDDDDQNMPTEVKVPSTDSLQRKPLASPHAADPPGLGRSASVDYSSSMNGTAAAASAAPPMRRAQSVGTPVPQEDVGSEGTSSSPYAAIAGAPPPQPLVPPDLSAEAFPPLVSSAPSQPAPTPARVRSAANNKSIDATSPIQIQKTQPLAVEESVELKTEPVPVSTNTTPASSLITPAPAPAVAPGPSIAPPPAAALGLAPGVGSDIGLGFGPSPFAPLAAVSNTSSSGPIGPSRGRAVGPPPGIRPPPGFSEPQSSSVSSPIGFNATGTSMLGLNAFSDSSWGFPDRFSSGGGLMRTNGFLGPDFSGQNSAESSRWSLNRLLSDLPPLAPRAPVSSQSQWEPGTSDADAMQLLQGGIPNLNPSPLTHSSATGRSRYAFVSEENDESGSALRPGPSFSHSVSPVAELDWQASLRAVLPPTATVNFGPSLRSEPPAVGISGLQQQLDTLATGSAIPPPSRSPTAIGSQISRFPTTAFPSASSADLSSSLFTRSDSLNGAPPTDPLFGAPGASAPSGSRLSLWSSAAMDASPPFQGNRFNGSLSSVSLDPVLNAPSRTAPIGSRPLLDPAIVAFKPPGALGGGLPDSFGLSMGFPGSNVGRASPTSTDPFRTGSRSSPIQQLMDARLSPQDPVFNPQPSAPKSRLPPGFENAQPILNLATPAPVSATPAPTPAPAAAAVIAASASATSAATSTDSPRKAPSTKGKGKGTTVVVAGGTGKKNTKNAPSTNGVGKKQSAPQMIST